MSKRYRIPDGAGGWLLDIPAGQAFTLHKRKYSAAFLTRARPNWLAKHKVEVYELGRPEPLTQRQEAALVGLPRETFLDLVDDLAGLGEGDPSALDWLRDAVGKSYLTPLRRRRATNLIEASVVRRRPKVDTTLWDDLFFQALQVEPERVDEAFLLHAAE